MPRQLTVTKDGGRRGTVCVYSTDPDDPILPEDSAYQVIRAVQIGQRTHARWIWRMPDPGREDARSFPITGRFQLEVRGRVLSNEMQRQTVAALQAAGFGVVSRYESTASGTTS